VEDRISISNMIDAGDALREAEAEKAAAIHYSFLPDSFSNNFLDIAVHSQPFGKIGGDFCSIFPVDAKRLILCMCDATGHDVASALFAARINTHVLTHAADIKHPCILIDTLNRFLCHRLSHTGIYASLFTVFIDMEQASMDYAGAGHPPALHYQASAAKIDMLQSETTFLGIDHPLLVSCSMNRSCLAAGDRIVLYTDGISEAVDRQGRMFGAHGIKRVVNDHHNSSSEDLNNAIVNELMRGNYAIGDDIMLMSVTIK